MPRTIALDGKALRHGFVNFRDRKAARFLHAFDTGAALVLAHIEIVREWLFAETAAVRETAADAFQTRAFETVQSLPLGRFHIRTAHQKALVGRVEGYGVFLWNVRRV